MAKLTWVVCFMAFLSLDAASAARNIQAAPPAPDCSSVIFDMMSCLDYVSLGSNVSKPTDSCCTGVVSVVKVSPVCLCQALQEAAQMSIAVNMTRAADLPKACSINVPSIDMCSVPPAPAPSHGSIPPTSSPASSPSSKTPASSPAPVTPSAVSSPPSGSTAPIQPPPASSNAPAASPTSSESKSGASALRLSILTVLVSIAVSLSSEREIS